MIRSFGDKRTEALFAGRAPKHVDETVAKRARRVLERIHAAHDVSDLRFPPSHRLHKLEGKLKHYWSVSVNMQWRVIFRFEDHHAFDVQIIDYH